MKPNATISISISIYVWCIYIGDTDLRPAGSASCLGDFYTGAYWGDVIANDCTPIPQPVDDDEEDEDNENESAVDDFKQDIWEKTPQTDTLTEMANVRFICN